MDEEITCAICQKSLDNVNDIVTLRQKKVRELTEQAASVKVGTHDGTSPCD